MEFSGTRLPELEVLLLLGKSFLTSGPFQTSGFKFIQHRLPQGRFGFPSLKLLLWKLRNQFQDTSNMCIFQGTITYPTFGKRETQCFKKHLWGWGYVGSKFLSHLQALHNAVQLQRCDWYPPSDVGWPHWCCVMMHALVTFRRFYLQTPGKFKHIISPRNTKKLYYII